MKNRIPILISVFAIVLAACSSGAGSEVHPFNEVQENEFIFEADVTDPNRGIFRVRTTEPMICAIVWGETEALGNFNNSLAMNGTGIIDHDVLLPSAEAGVEYFYKVQGSTADGTLYETELMTFTIIASDGGDDDVEDVDHGTNLALGGTIFEVSSEFSDTWAGANVIDDDLTTEWATSGDGDDAYIEINLGNSQAIGGVEFITRSMADGTAITTEFTVSSDGETLGPFPAGTVADPGFTEVQLEGQFIRFDVSVSTGGNTGAVEIRIFAPIP